MLLRNVNEKKKLPQRIYIYIYIYIYIVGLWITTTKHQKNIWLPHLLGFLAGMSIWNFPLFLSYAIVFRHDEIMPSSCFQTRYTHTHTHTHTHTYKQKPREFGSEDSDQETAPPNYTKEIGWICLTLFEHLLLTLKLWSNQPESGKHIERL